MAKSPKSAPADSAPEPVVPSAQRQAAESVVAAFDPRGTHIEAELHAAAARWLKHADSEGVA